MNPDQNRGGMTINALLQVALIASAIIPLVVIAVLGWYASKQINGSNSQQFVITVVFCAALMFVVVLVANYYVQKKIRDRFLGLVDVCRDYTGGDRTVRANVNGDDEFAMLSMSLNTLLDSQGVMQGGMQLSTSGDAAALQAQIEKLLQEVSAVGDGDLRVQAEVTPDTLGVLADSFNYMIEELAKVVGRVQATAVQVSNATRRILDRSVELSQASETQVAQISHTTEAVEALAIFIQNVARNAQSSADAAQDALHNANSGQQAVRQTIEGMMLIRENVQETAKKIKRLGERSNEIGEIVRIIEDIADQTNLLALNAAIQSAMAGEHGRGFAVVADEIRLLAERSTESTKRIATLVKSIQGDTYEAVVAMEDSTQEVVRGSQLADEAGRSLNSIYTAVERQAQMIEGIARAANEQATVSEAVAVAMGQISEITRQTDAGTQESAASVSYLAELADQLRASVSTFRLPERSNEVMDLFPGMSPINVMPEGNADLAGVGAGMDTEWAQSFSMNFAPLAEPRNSGSVTALTAHAGQSPFDNPQGFGDQMSFGGQQPFTSQSGFPGQQFANPPSFGGQQPFTSQSGFPGQQFANPPSFGGQQLYTSQPGFGEFSDFESQPGFNGQQLFDSPTEFGGQNQPFFSTPNQTPFSQQQNSGPLQPGPSAGSIPTSRQRWQSGSQQGQSSFSQEQDPHPNNGQFGQ